MLEAKDLEPARKELLHFLDWLLVFLEKLKEVDKGDAILFDQPSLGQLRDAWPSFQRDFSESNWTSKVNHAGAAPLQAHGLYGQQLQLKLWLVRYLLERLLLSLPDRYREHLTVDIKWGDSSRQSAVDQANAVQRQRSETGSPPGGAEKPKGLLRKLIEAIDVPLDSLIAALGLDGSVTEIKKAFGLSIDD